MKRLLIFAIAFGIYATACETTDKAPPPVVVAPPLPVSSHPPPPPPPSSQSVLGWDGTISQGLSQSVIAHPSRANRNEYAEFETSNYTSVVHQPVSTFAADVDTASYSFVRQYIEKGQTPPPNAVRVEEMINYFDYGYDQPKNAEQPFAANISIVPSPWNAETKLLQIGLQGYEPQTIERPDMNLVFLVDVSGSMQAENKLPLLKRSFEILTKQLTKDDTISIVTYASQEQVALKPTRGDKTAKILKAIRSLDAAGSTAGVAGMQMAYEQAASQFKRKGTNRIIMATDGDFNVGISDPEELEEYVSDKRKDNIYLSILGFGQGNLKDDRMQALAQNGNGIAAYIDSIREARKFFVQDMGKNLIPIANDLKLQVEFNPARVAEYRLIGYETRALKREDFSNDKVDAGDTGAGHSVTAIYEINPKGSKTILTEPLRYTEENPISSSGFNDEYAFLKIRYKKPGKDTSRLMTLPITVQSEHTHLDNSPQYTRFATSVAAYGLKLRGDDQLADLSWDRLASIATSARGEDPFGYRSEFVELVRNVAALDIDTETEASR